MPSSWGVHGNHPLMLSSTSSSNSTTTSGQRRGPLFIPGQSSAGPHIMSGSAPSTAGGLPGPLAMLMAGAGSLQGAAAVRAVGRVPRARNLSQSAGASSRSVVTGSVGGASSSSAAVRDGALPRTVNPVQLSEEVSRMILGATLQVMMGSMLDVQSRRVQLTATAVCCIDQH